jgi:ATP-binding cassette subfamily B protein
MSKERLPSWDADLTRAKTPLRFILAVSGNYKVYMWGAIFCAASAAFLSTFTSFMFKQIIDAVTIGGRGQISVVWFWAGMYVLTVVFLQNTFWRTSGLIGMRWSVGVRATATFALTEYVTRHSTDYFHKRFAGAIGGKVGNVSQALKVLIERFLWTQLELIVVLATTFFLAFYASITIGWIFLIWVLIILPLNTVLARRRVPLSAAAQKEDTKVRAQIIDLVTNIGAMHDFARRTYELTSLKKFILERYRAGIKNWTTGERNRIFNNLLLTVFMGSVMWVLINAWSMGEMTVGTIVLVLTLLGNIGFRVEEMGKELNELAEHYGEVKEGIEDLLNPYDIIDAPYAKPLQIERGAIEFIDVGFNYNEGTEEVFKNFTLSIQPGEKVGLVGRSGAGKSTLIKLLLRHYDVGSGKVLIDGQNIAQVTQESLREAIAMVPQEPLLFHRSIKENIAYGKKDAKEEEIRHAAELAHASEFIERLPKGYETLVGERGVKLSGGERQRVVLARAILKPAKILILDEATSSLDSESEAAIQHALHALMEGRTVIAIAHRLSTLREMDRIVVLDMGGILEDGSHEELLKKGGLYSELWAHQSGGYLQDE